MTTPESAGKNEATKFLLDQPIGTDRFGRSNFSRTLARGLVLPPKSSGLVVGLEGPWGSGKSFVINQVKSILEEAKPTPVILEFNPWVISGADGLIEALLEQLGSAVSGTGNTTSNNAARAGATILKYLSLVRHLKYLKYVPGATAFGNIAEDLPEIAEKIGTSAKDGSEELTSLAEKLNKQNLQSRRCAVEKALEEFDRPIIVIIDDLDRLPKAEIRSVMQAVKAVANFTRTSYLLAYDVAVVARALDKKKSRGIAYLEKIIQVQYPLPSPLPWRMRTFANSQFERTLQDLRRDLTPEEQARWPEAMSYVTRLCRHPRDVVRICNKLRISLPSTLEELDACDLILFETLAVCAPEIASAIRVFPDDFTGGARVNYEEFDHKFYFLDASKKIKRDPTTEKTVGWKKHLPKEAPIYLEGAIQFMFDGEDHGPLRISRWDRLYRLLSLGPAEHLTEVTELRKLVSNFSNLATALNDSDEYALSVLNAVAVFRSELSIPDKQGLLQTLVACSATRLAKGQDWRKLSTVYGDVIEDELRLNCPDIETQVAKIVADAPLSISEHILISIACDLGEWKIDPSRRVNPNKQLLPDLDAYKRLLALWLSRLDGANASSFALEPEPAAVLFRWMQLSDDCTGARKMAESLTKNFEFLPKLMNATQLDGRVRPTLGNLDLIWDRQELIDLIRSSSLKQDYAQALSLLDSDEVRNYFSTRGSTPTA